MENEINDLERKLELDQMEREEMKYGRIKEAESDRKQETAENTAVADVKADPVFNHQIEVESAKISPEAWKTPTEHDEVISRLSLEDGSKDLEPSWVGTALEDGSKFASWVSSESRCLDLAKIGCIEAVARSMRWEAFQDLGKIRIEDPPDGTEDDGVQERNRGKKLDEREEKLGTIKRTEFEKIKRTRKKKPLEETENDRGGVPMEDQRILVPRNRICGRTEGP